MHALHVNVERSKKGWGQGQALAPSVRLDIMQTLSRKSRASSVPLVITLTVLRQLRKSRASNVPLVITLAVSRQLRKSHASNAKCQSINKVKGKRFVILALVTLGQSALAQPVSKVVFAHQVITLNLM